MIADKDPKCVSNIQNTVSSKVVIQTQMVPMIARGDVVPYNADLVEYLYTYRTAVSFVTN